MLWGSTLRSPHPRARIRSLEIGPALARAGVFAVLTHEDVPGRKTYGLEIQDQPVLAWEDVRYQGEPVAIVAADHPETARAAAAAIEVDYEVLEPLTDPEAALDPETPSLHPSGNLLRHVHIEHGDPEAARRGGGHRRVRGRDAGPGVPRAGVGPRGARGGRRRRPLHRHAVAARRPGPARRLARPAAGEGAARARRRRRRVRRARGPLDAGPRLHARAAHAAAREDDVRARGVLLRAHPPPSGADALRAPRDARRQARRRARAGPARRRRLRLQLDRGVLERRLVRLRPLRGAQRARRRLRRLHRQPALRRDARLRRRADLLRARGADGQARGRAGDRPRRAAPAQRDVHRLHAADRRAGALPGAGGRAARARARHARARRRRRAARAASPT